MLIFKIKILGLTNTEMKNTLFLIKIRTLNNRTLWLANWIIAVIADVTVSIVYIRPTSHYTCESRRNIRLRVFPNYGYADSPPPKFCSRFIETCTMCWNEWKIIFSISIFWVIRFCSQFSSAFNFIAIKFFTKKNPSKVLKFTWKMRDELKQIKNPFSDFCDFQFLSYGQFCTQKLSLNWYKKDHISKSKNCKN